jgi:H+/Cl- antiporter ClcA
MQNSNSTLAVSIIIIGIFAGAISGFLVWRNIDLFISRRDRYIKSPFGLFKKKIGIAATVAGIIIFIAFIFASSLIKKDNGKNKTSTSIHKSK